MRRRVVILVILAVLGCSVTVRADDESRLAQLDQLLAEGRAAEAAASAADILEAGDAEARNTWRFRQRLGVALVAGGRPADAVPVLERALSAAPSEPALHLNLGRALRAIGHGGRAVAEFGLAVNLAPERHEWRLEYADALLAIGVRRDALEEIRRARALCDDCPDALRGEVNFYLVADRPADAIGALRQLQAIDPKPQTRSLLVRALWNEGDAASVATVLDTEPESELDGEELALLLDVDRQLKRPARALRWVAEDAEAVRRVARPTHQVWALVSEICLAGDRPDAALLAVDRALVLEPTTAVYHHNRAAVLVALGRDTEARQALAEARRLDPSLGSAP